MIRLLRRIRGWGIGPQTPLDLAQRLRLTNGLLIFLFFGSIAQTGICFFSGAFQAAALNATGPLVFAFGLWLMKSGRTVAARVFVFTVGTVAGYALVASMGPDSDFEFMLLFASGLTVAIFTSNKWLFPLGMLTSLLSGVLLEVTDFEPVFGMSRAVSSPEQLKWMQVASFSLTWALMAFHFFYFIRARLESQQQLIASAKLSAVGRMAAAVAHEVNNPLQLIVSHAERIKSAARTAGDARESIDQTAAKIQAVAMRIGSISRGLLALSRDAVNDPFVLTSVRSVVKDAVDFCRAHIESHKIDFQVGDIPENLQVLGNETQLSEVLLNVLNNALDAVLENTERSIKVDVAAEPKWIDITVTDSGPGIHAKIAHRIFEPFFTTKTLGKGVGLGLSISQTIMSAHGGKIYCESLPNGARFIIRLPRCDQADNRSQETV